MANPTKLIQAKGACHVVAAFGALNGCFAHGTHRHIFLMAITTPVNCLHSLLTRLLRVVCVFAIEANFSGADVTLDVLNFVILGDDFAFAVGFGAVSQ